MTAAEIQKLKAQLKKKWEAGEITASEYFDTLDLIDAGNEKGIFEAQILVGKIKTEPAAGKLTQEEYDAQKKQKYQDYKAGKITNYAYIQWKKQNNPAVQQASGAVSAPAAQNGQTPDQSQKAQNGPKTAGKGLGFSIPDKVTDDQFTVLWTKLEDAEDDGLITHAEFTEYTKQLAKANVKWKNSQQTENDAGTPAKMTQEEYNAKKSEMYKKYKAGEITNYAYIQWKKQNNPAVQAQTAPVSAPKASGSTNTQPATQAAKKAPVAQEKLLTPSKYAGIIDELSMKIQKGEITHAEYTALVDKATALYQSGTATEENVKAALGLEVQKTATKGMTEEQSADLITELYKKQQAGEITIDEYFQGVDTVHAMKGNGATMDAAAAALGIKPPEKQKEQDPEPELPPMSELQQKDLEYAVDKMFHDGLITEDEESDFENEIAKMYADGTSYLDAQKKLGLISPEDYKAEIEKIKQEAQSQDISTAPDKYDELIDKAAQAPNNYDNISYDEANKLIGMIEHLKATGVDPLEAEKDLYTSLTLTNDFGETIEDAMMQAAGYSPKAPAEPMNYQQYTELIDNVQQLMDDGTVDHDGMTKMLDELEKLWNSQTTYDQAEMAMQLMAQGKTAEDAEKGASIDIKIPMTGEEMLEIGKQIQQKYSDKKITWDQYNDLNDKVMAMMAKKATLAEVQAAVGLDPGTLAAEKAVDDLEKEMRPIYEAAAKEMKAQLQKLEDDYTEKLNKKYKELQDGKITKAEYDAWVKGQIKTADVLRGKIDQCAGVLLNANQKAAGMINGEQLTVFAENANFQSYQIDKDARLDLMFTIYDERTVERLIKDKPELLPRKMVNGKKDQAWNQEKIAKAVAQSIIQGDSIPSLARRVAVETASSNMTAMMRYARTAMTSAQNGGRMEVLHRAQNMGIKCKKGWLATLDGVTRPSHAACDGQYVGIDEKFSNGLMYPGDPDGNAGEIYNCRCTLVYEYEGFPADPTLDMRRDNETGQLIANMSYAEWKAAKQGSKLSDLNTAKLALAEAQKSMIKNKVSETKKYSGIWKDDVTLKDYPDKKDSISAKRDYYVAEIDKYKQAQADGKSWATDDKIKDLEKRLKQLNEFELHGMILAKRNKAMAEIQSIYDTVGLQKKASAPAVAQIQPKKAAAKKTGTSTATATAGAQKAASGGKKTPFGPEAYTKARKDKALWTSDQKKVDSMMRKRTGEVWSKATSVQKDAIYEYTRSYSKFNEPLRGIEYGTSSYKGVGKTTLNPRNNGTFLNAMTDIIEKCSYDHDMWLQRGCHYDGMDKFFGVTERLLNSGSQKDLEKALLGKTVTEYGFMSMGSAKGKGFDNDITLNIYAPAGTKMMYAEPFSAYGNGDGRMWDGKRTQTGYGGEFETIMQQGTQFKVTKVEKRGRQLYFDIEVINQDHQQRWKR